MKKTLIAFAAAAAALFAVPAPAAVLVDDGITYNLTENSVTNGGLTANFTLAITGIGDGRSGVNAFAFNDGDGVVSGTSSGFTFQLGGLNSNGCDGSGNGWFCFDNTGFNTAFTDALTLTFSVTSSVIGDWSDWAPSFKIDWTGNKNNYGLVSLPIPVNTGDCVGCTPDPQAAVPEPATWAMMLVGFGAVGFSMRRRRRAGLLQIA